MYYMKISIKIKKRHSDVQDTDSKNKPHRVYTKRTLKKNNKIPKIKITWKSIKQYSLITWMETPLIKHIPETKPSAT